ncbi:hypothetical protein [Haloarchaeobius iranensis]|uniref:Uncharacterized protein n=1 Tax=Haloarchaeobius iranensis TaxID=996166 RepID=A0A1G9XZA2_9EURY|nr:hypothetical protein [Haloarchaeobius iranensis]SDN02182.1 hypothetical protein SAMN05192554_11267 [Haloarchaeobius iranensis]
MSSRRSLLAAVGGTVAASLSGCQARSGNDTATGTPPPAGAPAPWVTPSSEADVVVENATDRELAVSVGAGRVLKEGSLEFRAHWVLENVIEEEATPTVTVTTEVGATGSVAWPEGTGEGRVAIFTIRPERIEADIELQDEPVPEYASLDPSPEVNR